MVKIIWDENYWRHRAEEARSIKDQIRNPECKRIMRKIAQSYDRLAEHTKDFQKAADTSHRSKSRRPMNKAHALTDDCT